MESTFSSPAEAALQREAGVPGQFTPPEDLDRVYELERVTKFVCDLGCQRVRSGSEKGARKGGAGRGLSSGYGLRRLGLWVGIRPYRTDYPQLCGAGCLLRSRGLGCLVGFFVCLFVFLFVFCFFAEAVGGGVRLSLTCGLYLQVTLQFPDQLLGDAGAVAARLEEVTGAKMFILGDTAYGRYGVSQPTVSASSDRVCTMRSS